jgi:hypothetical protein
MLGQNFLGYFTVERARVAMHMAPLRAFGLIERRP